MVLLRVIESIALWFGVKQLSSPPSSATSISLRSSPPPLPPKPLHGTGCLFSLTALLLKLKLAYDCQTESRLLFQHRCWPFFLGKRSDGGRSFVRHRSFLDFHSHVQLFVCTSMSFFCLYICPEKQSRVCLTTEAVGIGNFILNAPRSPIVQTQ